MSKIFVSHSSRDNYEAVALCDWLAREGWDDVFLDLDPNRGIAAGERWERKLHESANRCEAVIFLASANWFSSGWCMREYRLALALNKKLFAVVIDPGISIADLPEYRGTWQAVDLARGQDGVVLRTTLPGSHEEKHVVFSKDGLRRLKRGLDEAGLDPKFFAWPPERERDRPPYRGLKPLESVDAGIFFGRDAPIVEGIDRLRGVRSAAPPRILVILGASGAGKSSFLRAGLLPRLARDDRNFVTLPVIRPERAAVTGESGLLHALEEALPSLIPPDLRKAIKAGASGVRPLLAELAAKVPAEDGEKPPTIVLSIDQAEELFRPEGAAEGATLLELVSDLTRDDAPAVIAIFVIRSDSYDVLQRAKPLDGLSQNTLPLLPIPRGNYKDVIEGPARRFAEAGEKLTIEPKLTQRLLDDIDKGGGSDALPLLAFTLEQLFKDYRRSGVLRLQDYEDFGGLTGAIDAAVERAFQRAYDDPRIPKEREEREALLRRGLIPWLAGIDPETKTPRRNIAHRSEIPDKAAPLIDLLVEERLLSTDSIVSQDAESRIATIEPAHEALLRQWGLLQGWLEQDFGLLVTLEGVKRAARDWQANGRAEAWLTHGSQRLAEAQGLDARADIAAKLDAGDRAYLAACKAKEEAARADAEARRREREAEQARRLADAQAIAGANRRVATRTRIGLAVAVALVALAGAAALFGFNRATEAESNFRAARDLGRDLLVYPVAPLAEASERFDVLQRVDQALSALVAGNALDRGLALSRLQIWQDLARLQASRGNNAAAIELGQRQVAYTRTLETQYPADSEIVSLAASSLIALGDLESGTDKPAAISRYNEAVAKLRATEPLDSKRERVLALALERLGDILIASPEPQKARDYLVPAIAIRKKLVEQSPSDASLRQEYSRSLSNLAALQLYERDLSSVLLSLSQAAEIRRALVEEQPTDVERKRDLAQLLCRFAAIGEILGLDASHISSLVDEGSRLAGDLAILNPRNPDNAALIASLRKLSANPSLREPSSLAGCGGAH